MSINPTQQKIMEVFSGNRQYYLDFYQRDYQWKTDQMERLLDDLFHRFGLEYKPTVDVNEDSISRFDWYYLNAYVTNEYQGKTFIVDGQQRLTSITLILIKLYHMSRKDEWRDENLRDVLKGQVCGAGISGPTFWMGQDHRTVVLEDLFENGRKTADVERDEISFNNMYRNYERVSTKLEAFLTTQHMFRAFVIFFLMRVMLVRIEIQNTQDVPMVFEVINDRGVRLMPYEVLKGKLLGQIEKEEVDAYYEIWQKHVHRLQLVSEREVDGFFRFYFRAKYVETQAEYREFDGEYHKTIYESSWDEKIGLKRNPVGVKKFVKKKMSYFAELYATLLKKAGQEGNALSEHLYYNSLNGQDRQFLLILSACRVDDEDEATKVRLIARLFDRHYSLLQLTGAYDSNQFTRSLIELNSQLRKKDPEEIAAVYERRIKEDISQGLGVEIEDALQWSLYKDATSRNMGQTFLKYLYARVEHFLAGELQMAAPTVEDLVRKSGWKWGYHIEHILARNEENTALFEDEEQFYTERNRLGALLLLLGKDNMASQNESYAGKLKTYSHSLLWNQTLCDSFYHNNMNMKGLQARHSEMTFRPIERFGRDAIVERQQLLHEVIKVVWAPVKLEGVAG